MPAHMSIHMSIHTAMHTSALMSTRMAMHMPHPCLCVGVPCSECFRTRGAHPRAAVRVDRSGDATWPHKTSSQEGETPHPAHLMAPAGRVCELYSSRCADAGPRVVGQWYDGVESSGWRPTQCTTVILGRCPLSSAVLWGTALLPWSDKN